MLHPWNSTWKLEMMVSNRNLLFQGSIFRFHVCFGGCTFFLMNLCCWNNVRWSESHFKCEHLRLWLYGLWDEHRRTQWRGLVCRYWSSLQISPRYCRDPMEKLGVQGFIVFYRGSGDYSPVLLGLYRDFPSGYVGRAARIVTCEAL